MAYSVINQVDITLNYKGAIMSIKFRKDGIVRTIQVELWKSARAIKALNENGCDILRVGA